MDFDLQGHRGARGLMPENTIPGFLYAIDQGVTTLEMDVVISKDKKVVVSHDPYISSAICMDRDGRIIQPEDELNYNIFQMEYDTIKEYDCGLLAVEHFPAQHKIHTVKPLLSEVIEAVEGHNGGSEVNYNIEIKSSRKTDSVFHPGPKEFSDLVYHVVDETLDWKRVTIQSFDFRILQHFHEQYPEVRLALLIENRLSIEENLDSLGFKPDIYSCHYPLLTEEKIDALHQKGIKVIPWTVNEPVEMKKLIRWGVDGLITDYPNFYWQLGS